MAARTEAKGTAMRSPGVSSRTVACQVHRPGDADRQRRSPSETTVTPGRPGGAVETHVHLPAKSTSTRSTATPLTATSTVSGDHRDRARQHRQFDRPPPGQPPQQGFDGGRPEVSGATVRSALGRRTGDSLYPTTTTRAINSRPIRSISIFLFKAELARSGNGMRFFPMPGKT